MAIPCTPALIGHHGDDVRNKHLKIDIFDNRLILAPELKNGLGDIRAAIHL